jgi:S1-C subfamily serine protease
MACSWCAQAAHQRQPGRPGLSPRCSSHSAAGPPAAKAGLQPGDVFTAVNGTATGDTETLAAVLAGLRPGQQVSLTITKANGSTATINLTLGQLPGT